MHTSRNRPRSRVTLPALSPVTFGAGAFVAAVVAAGVLVGQLQVIRFGFTLAVVAVAAMCLAMAVYSRRTEGDPMSPLLILSGVFTILYVLRPLYILSTDRIGPTRALDDRAVGDQMVGYMTQGLFVVLAGLAAFFLGYVLHSRGQPSRYRAWTRVRRAIDSDVETRLRPQAAPLVVAAVAGVAVLLYGRLIREAGGIGDDLEALSLRSNFFGRAYLTAAALPLKMAALALFAVWISQGRLGRSRRIVLLSLIGGVAVGDLLTGGRAAILLGTILPVVVLIHYLRRSLTMRSAVVLLLAGLVLFVGVRVLTRDAVYAGAATQQRSNLLVSALSNLPETTVGGKDAIPFDSLVRLVEAHHAQAELQWANLATGTDVSGTASVLAG